MQDIPLPWRLFKFGHLFAVKHEQGHLDRRRAASYEGWSITRARVRDKKPCWVANPIVCETMVNAARGKDGDKRLWSLSMPEAEVGLDIGVGCEVTRRSRYRDGW